MSEQFSEAFIRAVELAESLGVSKINQLPESWEHTLNSEWRIAINGHNREAMAYGAKIPPFSLYAERNGWPVVMCGPAGNGVVVDDSANEDALIAALVAAKGGQS